MLQAAIIHLTGTWDVKKNHVAFVELLGCPDLEHGVIFIWERLEHNTSVELLHKLLHLDAHGYYPWVWNAQKSLDVALGILKKLKEKEEEMEKRKMSAWIANSQTPHAAG